MKTKNNDLLLIFLALVIGLLILLVGCSVARLNVKKTPLPPLPSEARAERAAGAPPPPPANVTAAAATKSVKLAWDPSPDVRVSFYRMHYGGKPGVYTNHDFATAGLQMTIPGLTPKAVYFFAVTAVNTNGVQSPYSNEVGYQVPGKRAKLTTQKGAMLNGSWLNIATNYDDTEAVQSSFYRVVIEEVD